MWPIIRTLNTNSKYQLLDLKHYWWFLLVRCSPGSVSMMMRDYPWERCVGWWHWRVLVGECCHCVLRGMEIILGNSSSPVRCKLFSNPVRPQFDDYESEKTHFESLPMISLREAHWYIFSQPPVQYLLNPHVQLLYKHIRFSFKYVHVSSSLFISLSNINWYFRVCSILLHDHHLFGSCTRLLDSLSNINRHFRVCSILPHATTCSIPCSVLTRAW